MKMSSLAYSQNSGIPTSNWPAAHTTPLPSSDPTIISLSTSEMQRLIDIERSAQAALAAMGTINLPNKHVTEAANALADALSAPAVGG